MARWACTFQLISVLIVCACIHGFDCVAERSASCSDGAGNDCTSSDHSSIAGSLWKCWGKKNEIMMCWAVQWFNFHTIAHLQRWSKYLHLINSSLGDDRSGRGSSCSEPSCCPHTSTITADLAVWRERGGITRQDFLSARQERFRGVHYQIIDHVLYREPDCIFGPRYMIRYVTGLLSSYASNQNHLHKFLEKAILVGTHDFLHAY